MLRLKADKAHELSEKIRESVEKIDVEKMVKDAIDSSLEKGNITKIQDDKEKLLDLIYNQTIKNYLDYVKNSSISEAKEKLKTEINEYNKNIKSILIKSENEVKEYQNKYLNLVEENKNLQEKLFSIQNTNRVLLSQVQLYQTNLEKIEKNYESISQQKLLFEEMIRSYPGKDPAFILKELENMKDGTIQMLKDYQNISIKLNEANEKQRKIEKEYRMSIDKLNFENKLLIEEKNSIDDKYSYKINTLEHRLADNEDKIKDNQFLRNTLYHIYNLLYKEFSINRNIKIDKKYLDIKESDFEPNFLYDHEIENYIKLMIKTMHQSTYDIIFRETMGYMNMILRIYLPNRLNLRFVPSKAFKEIKDFIDSKMRKIEENQKIIEKYKQEVSKKENELFQMEQKMEALNKEYNSYKKIVDKEFEKTNRIIFQLKYNKEKNISGNYDFNTTTKNISFNKDRINKYRHSIIETFDTFKDMTLKVRGKKSFSIKKIIKTDNNTDKKTKLQKMTSIITKI